VGGERKTAGSRPILAALGCLGAGLLLVFGLTIGASIGYLVYRTRTEGSAPTATPAPLARVTATAEPTVRPATPTATAPQRPTPTRVSRPTPSPAPSPTLPPLPTPTTAPPPTPSPTPAPAPAPTDLPSVAATPRTIEGWQEYRDPGYLRVQIPPGWLVVTTPEAPEYNLHSCHCYWMLMSQQMVQNSPSAEDVAAWFDSMGPDDLAPGGVLIEILRADSEYAPPVDWGTPFARVEIRPGFPAEYYVLDPPAVRKWGFRYRDARGRSWAIIVKTNDVLTAKSPTLIDISAIVETIDHR
jgi:hypothetical protein